jgi:hypothetical protein
VSKTDAIMRRERTRHPLPSMLRHQGEPTLQYLPEMCTKLAEKLEQEATVEREHPMPIPRGSRCTGRGEADEVAMAPA